MTRILVAERGEDDARSLTHHLRRHGFEAHSVRCGADVLERHPDADLVVLNLELTDLDGVQICRRIRGVCDTPIIAVTARDTELDKVLALQAGSDDCLAKPYGLSELVTRIETVMRRTRPTGSGGPSAISHGPLRIDPAAREVRLRGRFVDVTPKEFDLLYLLASHPDGVLPRRRIMSEVWGDAYHHTSRTIDTHVNSLRRKLGSRCWIKTVRGIGFRLGRCSDNSLT